MSYQGLSTSQLTPEMLQQMQQQSDLQKRQALAASLMQNSADPRQQNAGLANAGSDILGAVIGRNAQQQQQSADPLNQAMQQRYGMSPGQANNMLHPSMLSKLFNFGGGS